jgi:hypothetical protein
MKHPAETQTNSLPMARFYISVALAILLTLTVTIAEPRSVAADAPQFPVSGFFVRASTGDAVNAQKLADIKGAGGDTVITFGSHVVPTALGGISPDCRIGAAHCVLSAAAGVKLNRVFAYEDSSPWGAAAVACPRDRSIANNNKLFTILVLPTQGGPGATRQTAPTTSSSAVATPERPVPQVHGPGSDGARDEVLRRDAHSCEADGPGIPSRSLASKHVQCLH